MRCRPLISTARLRRSVADSFILVLMVFRRLLNVLVMKLLLLLFLLFLLSLEDAVNCLWSRARRRLSLEASISLAVSRPYCLRSMSASVI